MQYLFVFLLFLSTASADETPSLSGQQWLNNVSNAMKSLSYHGTVVFMKHGQIDSMKYAHTVEQGIETERLTSLNSPLRELTRKSSEISCLYKETSLKVEKHQPIDRSFIINLPLDTHRLDGQYLLAVAGQEMIALRPTQIIAILPKDDLRYARKIWVDTASLLPLKVEVYDLDGKILEQVLFTDFSVDESAGTSNAGHNEHEQHQHVKQSDSLENSPYLVKNWPAGFEKVFFVRNDMLQSKKSVEHLLISDGFSSISVYFEAKGDKGIEGAKKLGPVNSFSKVIGDLQVTALGGVPAKTVEFVVSGVNFK